MGLTFEWSLVEKDLIIFCLVSPQTVKQMWPYICQFGEKLLRETIEPAVKESNSHLSTFCFSKIDIGDKVSSLLVSLHGSKTDHMLFQRWQNRLLAAGAIRTADEGVCELQREYRGSSLTYVLVS